MSDRFVHIEKVEDARDEIIRELNYLNSNGDLDYAVYCELFNTIERELTFFTIEHLNRGTEVEAYK